MSSVGAPFKPALEFNADLTDWALKVLVSKTGLMRIVFSHAGTVRVNKTLKKLGVLFSRSPLLCSGNIFIQSSHNTRAFILGIFLVIDCWWCLISSPSLMKLIQIELTAKLGFCHKFDIQLLYRWCSKSKRYCQ